MKTINSFSLCKGTNAQEQLQVKINMSFDSFISKMIQNAANYILPES